MMILPCQTELSSNVALLRDRDVFEETPVAAAAHLHVPDTLIREHDIRGIPQREEREIVADGVPDLAVQLLGLGFVARVDRVLNKLIDLLIGIPPAVTAWNRGVRDH